MIPPRTPPTTAVVLDTWALLRHGVAAVLADHGIEVVATTKQEAEGPSFMEAGAGLLVAGDPAGVPLLDVVRRATLVEHVEVVALVPRVDLAALNDIFATRPAAVLHRQAAVEELHQAVGRVRAGGVFLATAPLAAVFGRGSSGQDDLLTARELEVTRLLAAGASNAEIAEALYVSPATVKTHLSKVYAKLGAANRRQAVSRALELNLLS
jgi:DNA-binding NarL/FixJ family response regulator